MSVGNVNGIPIAVVVDEDWNKFLQDSEEKAKEKFFSRDKVGHTSASVRQYMSEQKKLWWAEQRRLGTARGRSRRHFQINRVK